MWESALANLDPRVVRANQWISQVSPSLWFLLYFTENIRKYGFVFNLGLLSHSSILKRYYSNTCSGLLGKNTLWLEFQRCIILFDKWPPFAVSVVLIVFQNTNHPQYSDKADAISWDVIKWHDIIISSLIIIISVVSGIWVRVTRVHRQHEKLFEDYQFTRQLYHQITGNFIWTVRIISFGSS